MDGMKEGERGIYRRNELTLWMICFKYFQIQRMGTPKKYTSRRTRRLFSMDSVRTQHLFPY